MTGLKWVAKRSFLVNVETAACKMRDDYDFICDSYKYANLVVGL